MFSSPQRSREQKPSKEQIMRTLITILILSISSSTAFAKTKAPAFYGHLNAKQDCLEDIRDRREDIRDRREDILDRREDIRDARSFTGIGDLIEDVFDALEDVQDRAEDRRDRLEDIRDRRNNRGKRRWNQC
jgi:chromosome segregation ATPase